MLSRHRALYQSYKNPPLCGDRRLGPLVVIAMNPGMLGQSTGDCPLQDLAYILQLQDTGGTYNRVFYALAFHVF